MAKMWVLVANGVDARIFTAQSPMGPLQEVEAFAHEESRMKTRDLKAGNPGRSYDSVGEGRHRIEPHSDPKENEMGKFACELAERIEKGRVTGEVDELALVAAPAFLGLLRAKLGPEARSLVRHEISKNLAHADAAEVRKHLPERLWSAL